MIGNRYTSSDAERLNLSALIGRYASSFSEMHPVETPLHPDIPGSPVDVRAVLLDVYGTLLISEAGDIGLTALDSCRDQYFPLLYQEEWREMEYRGVRERLHRFIHEHHSLVVKSHPGIRFPEVDIISVWCDVYQDLGLPSYRLEDLVVTALGFEIHTNHVWMMPGVKDLLFSLKEAGIPAGIVSNAQFYTPVIMEYLAGDSLQDLGLEADYCSWSYLSGCGKPDPGVFHSPVEKLCRDYGISPGQILYVGNDMLNDICTASGLGLKTALFAGDARSLRLREDHEAVAGLKPDFVITELKQLKKIIHDGASS